MPYNGQTNASFAKNLRALLENSKERNGKTTQQELADYLGITKQAVSLYCKEKSLPNCYQLLKIAQFFGVSTDYLLTGNSSDFSSIRDISGLSDDAIEELKYIRNDKELENICLPMIYRLRAKFTNMIIKTIYEIVRSDAPEKYMQKFSRFLDECDEKETENDSSKDFQLQL